MSNFKTRSVYQVRQQFIKQIRRQAIQNTKQKIRKQYQAYHPQKSFQQQQNNKIQISSSQFGDQVIKLKQFYKNMQLIINKGIFYQTDDLLQIQKCLIFINQLIGKYNKFSHQELINIISILIINVTLFIKEFVSNNQDFFIIFETYIQILNKKQFKKEWLKLSNWSDINFKQISLNYYVSCLKIQIQQNQENELKNQDLLTNVYNFFIETPKIKFENHHQIFQLIPKIYIKPNMMYANNYLKLLSSLIKENTYQRIEILQKVYNIISDVLNFSQKLYNNLKHNLKSFIHYNQGSDQYNYAFYQLKANLKAAKNIFLFISRLLLSQDNQCIQIFDNYQQWFTNIKLWINLLLSNLQTPNYQNHKLISEIYQNIVMTISNFMVKFPNIIVVNNNMNQLIKIIGKTYKLGIESINIEVVTLLYGLIYNIQFWICNFVQKSQQKYQDMQVIYQICELCIQVINIKNNTQIILSGLKSIQHLITQYHLIQKSYKSFEQVIYTKVYHQFIIHNLPNKLYQLFYHFNERVRIISGQINDILEINNQL